MTDQGQPKSIDRVPRDELQAKAERVWGVFHDRRLKQEMNRLSNEERQTVNMAVFDLVSRYFSGKRKEHIVATQTKPHGTPRGKTGIDHCMLLVSHEQFGDRARDFYRQVHNKFIHKHSREGAPFTDVGDLPSPGIGRNSLIQIFPYSDTHVAIRARLYCSKSKYEPGRDTCNEYCLLSSKSSKLIQLLRSGKDARLFPHILRNASTIINPRSAVIFDVPLGGPDPNSKKTKNGAKIIDYETPALTVYQNVKPPVERMGHGKFRDLNQFKNKLRAFGCRPINEHTNYFGRHWSELKPDFHKKVEYNVPEI